jgi:hypothetical protein
MLKHLNRFTIPSLIALTFSAFAIAACGGDDGGDDAASSLAKYMPADALVYVEGSVRPDQEVADNVDEISQKLTGSSLSDTIDQALAEAQEGDITYEADVEPWLGENAAMYVDAELSGTSATAMGDDISGAAATEDEKVGLVAETTDVDAAQSFIDKAAAEQGEVTDNEYEGFSYKISQSDGTAIGIVDDNVVFATDEAVFKQMVDASKGDSLEGTTAFSDVIDKAADGSLVNMFVANEPILAASEDSAGGLDTASLYSSLGMNYEDTGTVISLVPADNEISIVGATNAETGFESGDPSAVIETFPANSVFATGTGDIGENITKVIDTVDEEGIEGVLEPGELKKNINEASNQGLDVLKIVESLQTVGFFVSGDSLNNLGGALVATTSDPEPLENALGAFSQLISLADDATVRPLGGGMTGLRIKTAELPGRPVVLALQDDRLVIAIGMPAARQALSGQGASLGDSAAYKAAEESLSGQNVDMFGNPAAVGALIAGSVGGAEAKQVASIMDKFEYMVSGSGTEDNTFAFNLGLKD